MTPIGRQAGPIVFGIADRAEDFEAIFRLNHAIFAGEIPQHAKQPDGRLVDRFHAENEHVIGMAGDALVAMLALRSRRPFSLDEKLPDLDDYLPAGRRIVEVRLLAVAPPWRRRPQVFGGLVLAGARRGRELGYDYAIISGTTRQLPLYHRLGFQPFGPRVGSTEAQFQPMALSLEAFIENAGWALSDRETPAHR
jgi:hypothetical protein